MNQELATELLENAGLKVCLAHDGQQALDVLSQAEAPFDGILMDCHMPVMDGYTATRAIRRMPGMATLPIIAMTANTLAGDRDKAIAAGMNDYIAKPLNIAEMFATLAQWITPANPAPAPLPADGRQEPALPETLPGIDIAIGLANTNGDTRIYRRQLEMFRDSQAHFAERFAAAQADADPQAASRCAHTLKGNAGTIGALAVRQRAEQLEHACRAEADAETIRQLLTRTCDELAPLIAGLQAALPESPNSPAPLAATNVDLDRLYRQLANQLAELDAEAVDTMETLLAATREMPIHPQLVDISRMVAGYDFDEARAALEKIRLS